MGDLVQRGQNLSNQEVHPLPILWRAPLRNPEISPLLLTQSDMSRSLAGLDRLDGCTEANASQAIAPFLVFEGRLNGRETLYIVCTLPANVRYLNEMALQITVSVVFCSKPAVQTFSKYRQETYNLW